MMNTGSTASLSFKMEKAKLCTPNYKTSKNLFCKSTHLLKYIKIFMEKCVCSTYKN